jgi:hypothetical protein
VDTKETEAVQPVAKCDHCGRAGTAAEAAAGTFCGRDFCRGVMTWQEVEQERDPVPPVERRKVDKRLREPRVTRTELSYTSRLVGLVLLGVVMLIFVVFVADGAR